MTSDSTAIDRTLGPSGQALTPHLPPVSRWFFRQFVSYTQWYLKRHFRQVLVQRKRLATVPDQQPLICLMNHPCWWDPLIGLLLAAHCFPGRTHYAAMDASALESYSIFKRLGFFGVERGTAKGALQFLRLVETLVQTPATALWITPQGQYADVRERPVTLMSGLGHALSRLERGTVLPIALEYVFGEERLPFAVAEFGEPIEIATVVHGQPEVWDTRLTDALTKVQDQLAARVMSRDRKGFEVLVDGQAGMGNWYGWWRGRRQRRTNR